MGRNFILFVFVLCFFAGSLSSQIDFKNISFQKFNSTAKSNGKPAMVYVHGVWCVSCQIMDETTFQSEVVAMEIADEYDVFKIDFDSEIGKTWVEEFDICCLPTILFFDETGNQIQKIQAPLTSTAMAGILKNPKAYNSKPEPAVPEGFEDGTIVMEEVSFSEEQSKEDETSAKFVLGSGDEADIAKGRGKEVINFSEQKSGATQDQKKGEFLYHLSDQIETLESLYIKYAVSDQTNLSDLIKQATSPNADPEIASDSGQDYPCSEIIENTEALYELIQELKDWEDRLRNPDYDIRPVVFAENPEKSSVERPKSKLPKENFTGELFRVQMGYFKNEKFAGRMAKDLTENYEYPVEIVEEEKPNGTYHRVLLGNFDSESEAKKVYQKMRNEGRKALMKKL